VCDLAVYLQPFMTRGRTEREIEAHLRIRGLMFRRKRGLNEEALRRAGAEKAPTGIWIPAATEEGVA
jgi:hypothetical protein